MLYRIEGTAVKIAGAPSVAPLDRAQVPRWLQHVFDDADRLAFAVDTEQIDPALFLLPAHQSLTVLSFFDAVAALWKQWQIPGHPARLKPWAVSRRLRTHLAKLAAPGAQPLLMAESRRRKEPPRFLDSPAEWIAAFDAVPLEEQLDQLERIVTFPEEVVADELAAHEAWTTHSLKAMDALLETRRQKEPGFCSHALDDTNRRWQSFLERLLAEHATAKRVTNVLVLVEPWHLCGPQGIVSLLTNKGQTVTRLL